MARTPKIRAMERDLEEYRRLVRNVRSKIRRVEQDYGIEVQPKADLPQKYARTDRDTIKEFGTRENFNKWKQEMESFTNRSNLHYQFEKNPYGLVKDKATLERARKHNKMAIENAKAEIEKQKDKPYISGGEEHGTIGEYASHMGEADVLEIHVPEEFDFDKIRNEQRFKDVVESMERRSQPDYFDQRQADMKDNFIRELEKSFHSDADELIRKLKDVPPDEFYDMYVRFDEFNFTLFYPPEAIDEQHESQILDEQLSDIQQMISYVDGYKSGKYNKDLKDF